MFFCLFVCLRGVWSFVNELHSRNSGECTCTCNSPVGSTPSSVEACGYVKRHITLLEKGKKPVYLQTGGGSERRAAFRSVELERAGKLLVVLVSQR